MLNNYNKFIGQSIQTIEKYSNSPHKYNDVDENDPVYLEVLSEANKDNYLLRVWLPNTFGTMDYRTDRLNISVDDNGKIEKVYIG